MRTAKKKHNAPARTRLKPELRRRLIVAAAFRAIAVEGFEGLRTRDVAQQLGINSATLHHYFPTKADLVTAVAAHLEERLRSEKSGATKSAAPEALETFDDQFEDVIFYQFRKPDILAVYREFVARAPRDPAIRTLVRRLHGAWKAGIVEALQRGQADQSIRADIAPEAVAGLILSTVWGLVSDIFVSADELKAASRQLKTWLTQR